MSKLSKGDSLDKLIYPTNKTVMKEQSLEKLDSLSSKLSKGDSLDKLNGDCIEKYKKDSVANDYGVLSGKVIFDEFIGICKKFYCLLMNGEVIKYRTKGIREESYYIDSVYIMLEVFKNIVAKIKIEIDAIKKEASIAIEASVASVSQNLESDWNFLIDYLDSNQELSDLQTIYSKLKTLFSISKTIENTVSLETFKLISNYYMNSNITSRLVPFKDNVKTVYETLLERPLYFTSSSFISSRRKGKFTYSETLKIIQRDFN